MIVTIELKALQDIDDIGMILNDVQVISSGGTIADATWKEDGGEEEPGTKPGEGEKPGTGEEETPKPGDDGDTGIQAQQGTLLALFAAAGAAGMIIWRRKARH